MLRRVRETLEPLLIDPGAWEKLSAQLTIDVVVPGQSVRVVGESVHDVLVVLQGSCEVVSPGEPPQWATPGAMIGLAASLSGAASRLSVTALRHGRVARIPARALWDKGGDVSASIEAVAQLARLPDHGLSTLPPDPLVITVVLEGLQLAMEESILQHMGDAVREMDGGRLVRVSGASTSEPRDLAEELAAHESGARTVVYVVRGDEDGVAASIVEHADRVVLMQTFGGTSAASQAQQVACDGTARRYTELVYVTSETQSGSLTTRQILRPQNVMHTHLLPELSATRLQLLLDGLRQGAREHETLRDFELFAELTGPELAWVQSTLRWERVDGGSLLVREGEETRDVWLVRAGRLKVVRDSVAGERHLGWLGPGAVVGVTALLSDERRTASVRAVRDSTVARLDRDTISTLLERSIGFVRTVARVLATRMTGDAGAAAHRARTFTVVPLTNPERVAQFVAALAAAFVAERLKTTVVDATRLNAALGSEASTTRRGDVGDGEIISWLDQLERHHDAVILVGESQVDSWTRRAARQSDHLLLVADATSSPELRPIELVLFGESTRTASATRSEQLGFVGAKHLVLLQPPGISEATGTGAWLTDRTAHTHHHVRDEVAGDISRLARRISDRAVALALSGASSRAPAHFGVVRAMEDHSLPIDIVSGTSSGAGVAALVASGMNAEEGLEHAIAIITKGSPKLHQFQPPVTALTSGASADQVLQGVYGDRQLEDQIIPTILTAVDIRRHRLVQLTQGPIWKLVRASGSLPLLWPPVWHNDDLLVDGGIINYLPVELFGEQADEGLVIASNLDETAGLGAPAFEGTLQYGSNVSGWRELVRRVTRSSAARPPGLVDILFHTMSIPNFQRQEGHSALAERENVCMLTPPLGSFGLFDVTAAVGRSLETVSWEHAHKALDAVAAKWNARR